VSSSLAGESRGKKLTVKREEKKSNLNKFSSRKKERRRGGGEIGQKYNRHESSAAYTKENHLAGGRLSSQKGGRLDPAFAVLGKTSALEGGKPELCGNVVAPLASSEKGGDMDIMGGEIRGGFGMLALLWREPKEAIKEKR